MNSAAFRLYIVFIASWFLHLPSRFQFLGVIRFDLCLIALISLMIFLEKRTGGCPEETSQDKGGKLLKLLLFFIVASVPFVEWPGTVFRYGIPAIIKAVVFYYFTVSLVTTQKRLKLFIALFLVFQSIRVIEPVYLHMAEGYWGDRAYMSAGSEFMNRLSGAPHDIINPNGLAFVIVSILPFSYYLSSVSPGWAIPLLATSPILIYGLVLTGSRSGLMGLLAIMIGIFMKSRRKATVLICFAVLMVSAVPFLSADQRDRYLSIIDSNTKNAITAEGRTEGTLDALEVALRRPIFGHGIGTSREANANFGNDDKRAHNLFAELFQEVGMVGLVIFLLFIKSIIQNFSAAMKTLKNTGTQSRYLANLVNAMQVWLMMNILFSLASYGLSSYEWYLFAGLSVSLCRMASAGELDCPIGALQEK